MMIDDADSSADPLDDVEAMPSTLIKSHYQKQGPKAVARLYDAVYYMQNRETGGDEEPGPRALFEATGDMMDLLTDRFRFWEDIPRHIMHVLTRGSFYKRKVFLLYTRSAGGANL